LNAAAETRRELGRILRAPQRLLRDRLDDREHVFDAMAELANQKALRLVVPPPFADVARGSEPFHDLSVSVEHRNGPRMHPPRRAVDLLDLMLELERGLG
jgi:hypothetical protein